MKILIAMVAVFAAVTAQSATYGQRVVAAVLLGEARGEGTVGMTAVAEVIRTRADAQGRSPLGVVTRRKHFSCLNGTTPERLVRRFMSHPKWEEALRIARVMYNTPERLPGYSRGANHFTRKDERPYWARGHRPVAVIGNHAFYRL